MCKKILLVVFMLLLILSVSFLGFVFYFYRQVKSGQYNPNTMQEEKNFVKKIVWKIKNRIYYEATIHNPPGDMIPDQWDDEVKGAIKNELK